MSAAQREGAATAGIACGAIGVLAGVVLLTLQPPPALSPQSLANLRFVESPSLPAAIGEYPRLWPPLYPSLLWLAASVGVSPLQANLLLYLGSLPLVALASRRFASGLHPGFALGLWAVCAFHAANLSQLVSEALLIPLALGVLLLLARPGPGSTRGWLGLALCVMAACLTRYFAIVWLAPAAVVGLLAWGRSPGRSRTGTLARVVAFSLVCLGPVGAWMLEAAARTGHWTGMDRFGPRLEATYTSLGANLRFSGRSLMLDWLSPSGGAGRGDVGARFAPDALDATLAVLALGLLLAALAAWIRRARRSGPSAPGDRRDGLLVAWFSLGYLALVVALWTVGNNDPIYSRFLYPGYPFLLLGLLHLHARLLARGATGWERLPVPALLGIVGVVQVGRGLTSLTGGG